MTKDQLETVRAGGVSNCSEQTFDELCRLALRGLPPVLEWKEGISKQGRFAHSESGVFGLGINFCDRGVARTYWAWDITAADSEQYVTFISGTADSLEAAKAAAEAALEKLLRGGE